MQSSRKPIANGGGPCFDITWPNGNPFGRLYEYLAGFASQLGARPRAILVVSAHWETERAAVTSAARPALIYDYTGFPAHTYSLRYDVPGSPELAARVCALLSAVGIAADMVPERGLDHGVFVPMRVMYPAADIPIVQLSILAGYDPGKHFELGAALAPLRDEGILIIGSGMSFHNLRTLFSAEHEEAERFDTWLTACVTSEPAARKRGLQRWLAAPSARAAQPEEDHLVPLFVAAGAASSERAELVYHDRIFNKAVSGYRFGPNENAPAVGALQTPAAFAERA